VHDIDFVVVTKNDAEWQKISEKLKHLKAKSNCSGNSVIKAFVPCQNGLFQLDFYRAKPSTFGIYLLVRLARQTITCGLQATPFPKECESGTAKA